MKKMRRGFTLLELLVVIGVMGIMSSMAMIAGQQTTDAARATNIADNLEKAAAAMMMYYSDNADVIAVEGVKDDGSIKASDVLAGTNAYLKSTSQLVDTAAAGKYAITIDGTAPAQTWWIVYTLPDNDLTGVGPIMKNKASRLGLMKAATSTTSDYDGTQAAIYMKVR